MAITNVSTADAGNYSCTVRWKIDSEHETEDTVDIEVFVVPGKIYHCKKISYSIAWKFWDLCRCYELSYHCLRCFKDPEQGSHDFESDQLLRF